MLRHCFVALFSREGGISEIQDSGRLSKAGRRLDDKLDFLRGEFAGISSEMVLFHGKEERARDLCTPLPLCSTIRSSVLEQFVREMGRARINPEFHS